MRVLLVESVPGTATALEHDLVADGHEVVSCHDEHGGPCRGAAHHADCPLESHTDLAIVARTPDAPRLLAEMGGVCAAHHRVPVVEVDPADPTDGLPDLTATTALGRHRVETGYADAIRRQFADIPALVDVRRETNRVVATVQIPADLATTARIAAVADRTRLAIRDHDPFVPGIDVNVTSYPVPVD